MSKQIKKYYLKYLMMGLSLFVIIIILSLLSLALVRKISNNNTSKNFTSPEDIINILIDNSDPKKRLEHIDKIHTSKKNTFHFNVYIADENNTILSPYSMRNKRLPSDDEKKGADQEKKRKPLLPFHLNGPPQGPPKHMRRTIKYPLKEAEKHFLVFVPKENFHKKRGSFLISLGVLLTSLILGIGFTIFFTLLFFRKQVLAMDIVMEELKRGNLKARVDIKKFDEFAQSKIKFNKMAEEIESLVTSLRKVEASRKTLMSELAHDLRTPIASLRSAIEIVMDREELLTVQQRKKFLSTSLKEIDYFSLLVDDLLFLGQVNEPHYKKEDAPVDIEKIITLETEFIANRYKGIKTEIFSNEICELNVDKKLITRLFRNALENTCSFAKENVTITIKKQTDSSVSVVFEDDGPGFSQQSLDQFGKKKFSREIQKGHEERISVGLGSVIMSSIVESHNGTIRAENRIKNGSIAGASLSISLPFK